MSAPKPLSDEALRIINAILEDRLGVNKHGRYVIDGEERPDRKTREQLQKQGLIKHVYAPKGSHWRVTAKGNERFKADIRARVAAHL